jgi:phospholipid-binding lipoprotein MlaA
VENVNDGLRQMINNFAENLSVPGDILNNVLQGEFQSGLQNTGKFLINSTLGFAGLGTPAEDLGIGGDESDFGTTLHTWGVDEGFYVELPFFGPSTSRDATGKIVDWIVNPLAPLIDPPVNYYTTSSMIAKAMDTRVAYAGAFDSVLYDSIDSYSQSKLIYLQTRRYSLGGRDEDVYDDPYEDLYGTE